MLKVRNRDEPPLISVAPATVMRILRLCAYLRHQLFFLLAFLLERFPVGAVLYIAVRKVVLSYSFGNFSLVVHSRQLLGSVYIAHLLGVSLGEDEVNLLERTASSFGVEEVDDGDKAGV
jgi:hypothetical protein